MTDAHTSLRIAEAEAAAARSRLSTTVAQLQTRLDPKLLADDAKRAGLMAAQAGVDRARRNPKAVAGAVAAAGLLLARRRIFGMFSRRSPSSSPTSSARE